MRSSLARIVLIAVCAAGVSGLSEVYGQAPDLEQRLSALMQTAPAGGSTGVQVVDVATGAVLFHANEDRLLLPASNLKILTSALAWERLKPNYNFVTKVVRESSGDVVLAGAGDPSISGRIFPFDKSARSEPPLQTSLQAIEDLADQMVAHGLTVVHGDIVGDDRLYPWEPYPSGWTADDMASDYGAPVSALSLNENIIGVSIRPGERVGDPAVLAQLPGLEFFTIDNQVVTTASTGRRNSPVHIRAHAVPGSGYMQWRIVGSLPIGHAAYLETLPVGDPALFAATALYDALLRRGVAVQGGPVARHRSHGEPYVPVSGEELASRTSPPLSQLLQMMDKISLNLYAEMFLRETARVAGSETASDTLMEAGAKELGGYLSDVTGTLSSKLDKSPAWHIDDGSGLSRNSLVTARLLTAVLTRMARSADREAWLELFPIGGEDGTLESRLCCMAGGLPGNAQRSLEKTAARGIQAKTGSLDRAATLSGYAKSPTHGLLAFSILVNDFSGTSASARAWIDKIALALVE